jgi:hypothetical protein
MIIIRFKSFRKLGPGHDPAAVMNAAFNYTSLNAQYLFE